METEAAVAVTHQKPYFMSKTTVCPLKPLTLTLAKTEPAKEMEDSSESTVWEVSQDVPGWWMESLQDLFQLQSMPQTGRNTIREFLTIVRQALIIVCFW